MGGPCLLNPEITFFESTRVEEFGFAVRKLDDEVFVVKGHDFTMAEALVDDSIANLQVLPWFRLRPG